MLWDFAIYFCLAVLHKIICLHFFICILLSVLLFPEKKHTRESPSVSILWCFIIQNSESACSRSPYYTSHQGWLYPDLAREWNKRARWIWHFQMALANPWFGKQGATLANFILCYQKIFVPKRFVIKIHTFSYRWSANFWLVFAFYLISYCYNLRKHYRNLECRNKTVWMFNRDQNFRGTSFPRND